MNSFEIENSQERVNVLKPEIVAPSEFTDAEYDLFNVNGFSNSRTMVPGASYTNFKFVVKVNPKDIVLWTDGLTTTDSVSNLQWVEDLISKRKQNWERESTPVYFTSGAGNDETVVYLKEGYVFKKIIYN